MSYLPAPPAFPRHIVTAVLVAHDGARWLPTTVDALVNQQRPVQRVIAVDTGSTDDSAALLRERLGGDAVVTAGRTSGFGDAVDHALHAAPPFDPATLPYRIDVQYADGRDDPLGRTETVEWLWLLHDDSEPAPDALQHLLRAADELPSVAVLGPKVRSWYDSRQLLEVGTSIARSGRRWTGLERREQDQGQHDQIRGVLSVSSAGMLVRRDVFERLGGFDPNLPLSRDDTDFGWRVNAAGHRVVVVPDAAVQHAEAATRDRRPIDAAGHRPHRVDRAGAAYTLLANVPGRTLAMTYLRLFFGGILRTLGYLVGKLPGLAVDELLGTLSVLARPGRVFSGRRDRAKTNVMDSRDFPDLFPARGATIRQALDQLFSSLTGRSEPEVTSRRARVVESGPVSDDADSLDSGGSGRLRALLRRPGLLLTVGLLLLTVLATRSLWGSGVLTGGALLPAPEGASDLWRAYTDGWHGSGLGSAADSPPYLLFLSGLATLLLGKASAAVTVVLVGSVPLAGVSAYLAARRFVPNKIVRAWGAATYALLPVATGAIAAGRIGTAVVLVVLPMLARSTVALFGTGSPTAKPRFRYAFAVGLLLAVGTAFVPLLWPVAVFLAVVGLAFAFTAGPRDRWLPVRTVIALVTPLVLLFPWAGALFSDPKMFLLEPGLSTASLVEPDPGPLGLLLMDPGGPGTLPGWLTAGLVLAALAALLRDSRRRAVLTGWAVAVTGLLLALLMGRADVTSTTGGEVPAWPGLAAALIGLGYVTAAVIGAENARQRVAAISFGWRQPVAGLVTVLAAITPVAAGLWWLVQGVDGPVERRDSVQVPAFIAADKDPRTLVLKEAKDGALDYTLVRGGGNTLGDADVADTKGLDKLNTYLEALVAGSGGADARGLAGYGVKFVLVKPPVKVELVDRLDGIPGLKRVSTDKEATTWRLEYPVGGVSVQEPDGRITPVAGSGLNVKGTVGQGGEGRVLRLAENADSGWQATLDGKKLAPKTVDGWAQGFTLPAGGGKLAVTYDDGTRGVWTTAQLALLFVVLVLALPGRRRGLDDDLPETPVAEAAGEGTGRRGRRAKPEGAPAEETEVQPAEEPVYADPAPADYSQPDYAQTDYAQTGFEQTDYGQYDQYAQQPYSEHGYGGTEVPAQPGHPPYEQPAYDEYGQPVQYQPQQYVTYDEYGQPVYTDQIPQQPSGQQPVQQPGQENADWTYGEDTPGRGRQ